MSLSNKLRTVFRGDLPARHLPREFMRRRRMAAHRAAERQRLDQLAATPARLASEFAELSPDELLAHLRDRSASVLSETVSVSSNEQFAGDIQRLLNEAASISAESSWPLAGFGRLSFERENLWRSDPFTSEDWGLDYHADVILFRPGGPDIRVLWELNRLGHLVTLAFAYRVRGEERFAETFFSHIESWTEQNPYGRGANWNCAMEVALRAINVLAAFDAFRSSRALTAGRVMTMLRFFDQHGRFILDNNEFSYVGTSNHYLSDVAGLFWIGVCLPELEHAAEWRDLGASELQRESRKQVLPDGADFEASTGYHGFVTELLLYSYLAGRRNGFDLGHEYVETLARMVDHLSKIVRPDGRMPLIGDADGSHIVPAMHRDAGEYGYLISLWDIVTGKGPGLDAPEVVWWGGPARTAVAPAGRGSVAFPNAGAYVMRDGDLYLHFNASDVGANGRGSHAHNDALSVELCIGEQPLIVDPGSYVYNLDREARHQFRSTAFHSTMMVDGVEQNTIAVDTPFIMGNEARPKVLSWGSTSERDRIAAEHYGYRRLDQPVVHRRTVTFDKAQRFWTIEDEMTGTGRHSFAFSFHLESGVNAEIADFVTLTTPSGPSLLMHCSDASPPVTNDAWISRSYGHRERSLILKWELRTEAPLSVRFVLIPLVEPENIESRLELLRRLADNI